MTDEIPVYHPHPKEDRGGSPYAIEVGARLRKVLDLYPSRTAAAQVAGVSVDQLLLYLSGATKPRFFAMAHLCRAKQVSLDWLATGHGSMYRGEAAANASADYPSASSYGSGLAEAVPTLDFTGPLRAVIEAIERRILTTGHNYTPAHKAELIVMIFKLELSEPGRGLALLGPVAAGGAG